MKPPFFIRYPWTHDCAQGDCDILGGDTEPVICQPCKDSQHDKCTDAKCPCQHKAGK